MCALRQRYRATTEAALMAWHQVSTTPPPVLEIPYQVLVICVKEHGKDSVYAGQGIKRVQQDWVVRQWPQNFTHWQPIEALTTKD